MSNVTPSSHLKQAGRTFAKGVGIVVVAMIALFAVILVGSTEAGKVLQGLILVAFIAVFYFLPALVARSRQHSKLPAVFVLNLLLGWTLLGWVLALVWAYSESPGSKIACPYCAEWIKPQARVCPHCQRDVAEELAGRLPPPKPKSRDLRAEQKAKEARPAVQHEPQPARPSPPVQERKPVSFERHATPAQHDGTVFRCANSECGRLLSSAGATCVHCGTVHQ